jgi:hypothetical protein
VNGHTILRDVGETMKQLLLSRSFGEPSNDISIEANSPAELEPSTTPKLSIYLYKTAHNVYSRNEEPIYPAPGKMQAPPLVFDLHYLFTPYAPNRETELIILESLVRCLYDYAVFKGDILKGSLKESGNEEIRVIPEQLSLDELNKLWGTFSNKPYKLSASYLLTPVRIPSSRIVDANRVVSKEISLYLTGEKR